MRGASLDCALEFNDPRLSGTMKRPNEGDAWGSDADGAMVSRSPELRVENGGPTREPGHRERMTRLVVVSDA